MASMVAPDKHRCVGARGTPQTCRVGGAVADRLIGKHTIESTRSCLEPVLDTNGINRVGSCQDKRRCYRASGRIAGMHR
eukprot:3371588-Alexandrium_andersonii.AAC.1